MQYIPKLMNLFEKSVFTVINVPSPLKNSFIGCISNINLIFIINVIFLTNKYNLLFIYLFIFWWLILVALMNLEDFGKYTVDLRDLKSFSFSYAMLKYLQLNLKHK